MPTNATKTAPTYLREARLKTKYAHQDLSGKRFGLLSVLCKTEGRDRKGAIIWKCACDCGNETNVRSDSLLSGHTRSCGCLIATVATKHGMRHTRLYRIWGLMKSRCFNPNRDNFASYGGRGITVCEEWINDFPVFRDWALSNGYNDGLSIDRIDNDGNYEASNCRWVSPKVQCNNRRNNKFFTVDKETLSIAEWARRIGIRRSTLWRWLNKGESLERKLQDGKKQTS
jgi:hypothetical protein